MALTFVRDSRKCIDIFDKFNSLNFIVSRRILIDLTAFIGSVAIVRG